MAAGDLAGAAIRAWFSKFIEVLVVAAVFTVPIFIINAVVVAGLTDSGTADIGDLAGGALLGSLISILLSSILTAALVHVFLRIYRNETFSVGSVLEFVVSKIGPIFVFALLSGFLILVGFIALILPGIALIIVFSMGTPALLDEDLTGVEAIWRSFQLIKGNWGIALAVVLIGLIINIAASFIFGGLAVAGAGGFAQPDFNDFTIVGAILQILTSSLLAPLIPALATVLYFEVKGRDYGFPSL